MDALGALDTRTSIPLLPNLRATVQVADFSRSFATETIERRAISGFSLAPSVGDYAVAQIQSLGRGGIVVENLVMGTEFGFATNFQDIVVNVGPQVFTTGAAQAKTDIGGTDTDSVVSMGYFTTPVLSGESNSSLLKAPESAIANQFVWRSPPEWRLFVKPSEFITLTPNATGLLFWGQITWRELPDPARLR